MKIKIYSIFALILMIPILTYAQNSDKAIREEGYTKIFNTRLYAKIPENFKVLNEKAPVIKKDGFTYIFLIEKKQNYFDQAKAFDYNIFNNGKSKVTEHYDLKIDAYPAKYMGVEKNGMKMHILIFGDKKFFITALGMNKKDDKENEKIIKNVLFNLKYSN